MREENPTTLRSSPFAGCGSDIETRMEDRCVLLWDELVRREGSPADAVAVLLAFAVDRAAADAAAGWSAHHVDATPVAV